MNVPTEPPAVQPAEDIDLTRLSTVDLITLALDEPELKEACRQELQRRPRRTIPCPSCGRSHRSWHTFAACFFRRGLLWVSGDPPLSGLCFALASDCRHPYPPRPARTVTLWATEAEALEAKEGIDKMGCGGSCSRQHRIYALHFEVD